MEESSFDFDFHTELPDTQDALRREAETRLRDLAAEDTDMIGASAVVEQSVAAETPYLYQARVTAYIKPDNLAAVEKADDAVSALKGALDALERQVRELRDMRREPWKKP